jgi:anti-sigma factor RsiW
MSSCEEHSTNILLFLDNDLHGKALEDFFAHLETCAACKKQLEEEQALSGLFQRTRPFHVASEELRARVAAVVEQAEQAPNLGTADSLRGRGTRPRIVLPRHWARWGAIAATLLITVGLALAPAIVQRAAAATFIDTAVTAHRSYESDQLPLEIRSDSPAEITAWFTDKVPFQFRLPAPQTEPDSPPPYTLTGARLVTYKHENAALVTYRMKEEAITLLIASSKTAAALGGDEVRSGGLTFHYVTKTGLNVITWSVHGLTYALVSPVHDSAQHPCLVCHQNMADKNDFR